MECSSGVVEWSVVVEWSGVVEWSSGVEWRVDENCRTRGSGVKRQPGPSW